nr:hypothetical protein P5658_25745 [Bacillus subtilis]WGE08897.1 hypothetical protein P5658_25705 [Bacillus subtilis]
MEGCGTIRQGVSHPKWKQKGAEQGRVTRLTLFSPLGFYGRQWASSFARLTLADLSANG